MYVDRSSYLPSNKWRGCVLDSTNIKAKPAECWKLIPLEIKILKLRRIGGMLYADEVT